MQENSAAVVAATAAEEDTVEVASEEDAVEAGGLHQYSFLLNLYPRFFLYSIAVSIGIRAPVVFGWGQTICANLKICVVFMLR